MKRFASVLIVVALTLFASSDGASAEEGDAIKLSPEVRAVFVHQMRIRGDGTAELTTAFKEGRFNQVAKVAATMTGDYILDKKLSATQKAELNQALRPGFDELNSAFHGHAGEIANAAKAKNSIAVEKALYKLFDTCKKCHIKYGGESFEYAGETFK
jgi:thiamine biosynthesis lipoprotein ApbE